MLLFSFLLEKVVYAFFSQISYSLFLSVIPNLFIHYINFSFFRFVFSVDKKRLEASYSKTQTKTPSPVFETNSSSAHTGWSGTVSPPAPAFQVLEYRPGPALRSEPCELLTPSPF